MKVDFNLQNQNKSNNFGMALHMNESRIERKLGKAMADGARKARPTLEILALNCDVSVKPFRVYPLLGSISDVYKIKVTKKGHFYSSAETITHDRLYMHLMRNEMSFSSELINRVKNLKNALYL